MFALALLASAQSRGQVQGQVKVKRSPRIPGPSDPQAVLSMQWHFYISGDRLFYRSGTAPGKEPFQMVQLPAAALKIAADSAKVYIWLKDSSIAAYAVGDSGPTGEAIRLPGSDPDALAALSHPLVEHMSALSTRPPENVAFSPQRLLVANSGSDSISACMAHLQVMSHL